MDWIRLEEIIEGKESRILCAPRWLILVCPGWSYIFPTWSPPWIISTMWITFNNLGWFYCGLESCIHYPKLRSRSIYTHWEIMSANGGIPYHGGHYTSRQHLLLGVTGCGLVLSTLAVSLRLIARRYLHVKLWWDDYLAVLAMVHIYRGRNFDQSEHKDRLTWLSSDNPIHSSNQHHYRYDWLSFPSIFNMICLGLTGRTILGVRAGLGRHSSELSSDQAKTIGIVRSSIGRSFKCFIYQWWVRLDLDSFHSSMQLRDSICLGQCTSAHALHSPLPLDRITQGLLDCWSLLHYMGCH